MRQWVPLQSFAETVTHMLYNNKKSVRVTFYTPAPPKFLGKRKN